MTHFELANLMTDYIEGTLDHSLEAQARAHLDGCSECSRMVEDVRMAIATCRDAQPLEPPPWLVSRIMRATVGERKPGLYERLLARLRPAFRPQVAYSLSMAIFSVSFILFTAKVNLRSMRLRDLNPATWVYRANSRGHMLMARAQKYYYDIRFVYDVQSLIQDMRQQPGKQPSATPKGGKAHGSASSKESPDARNELAKEAPIFSYRGGAAGRLAANEESSGRLLSRGREFAEARNEAPFSLVFETARQ
ncbi:MAG: zf-HC2 domain-containing protein [Acidobacteriota bacterium]|nr:zf-HC2 domain-containing protein [Acidobacteriota bacterium]